MLKGYVFKNQFFESHVFASFINTFLGGRSGIDNNFKNGMKVTYSESNLTVQSGLACIKGRFVGEDTSTDIPAGTDNAYCKLVIEIDLDKENTDSNFLQGAYKIVKSASSYPNLTQTDIVKNNSGIYQYELARFRTSSSGITDFTDMRTFLDFEGIYSEIQKEYRKILTQLQQELASVEDGSEYILKKNIKVLTGKIKVKAGSDAEFVSVDYPDGWNMENTIVISASSKFDDMEEVFQSYTYGESMLPIPNFSVTISQFITVDLHNDYILVQFNNNRQKESTGIEATYKVVLKKVS